MNKIDYLLEAHEKLKADRDRLKAKCEKVKAWMNKWITVEDISEAAVTELEAALTEGDKPL